ncbi:F-box/kelch-repeat protein SKIP4-like isoform X2 [Wolffia australiana]
MAAAASSLDSSCEFGDHHAPLISGLPDDIALICLAWVPRRYYNILRCVSKRWKSLLGSKEFQQSRKEHNMQESWVYAVCRLASGRIAYYVLDPFSRRRCWTALQSVPPQCCKREGMSFETLGSKLFVLGGCSWQEDATDEVYVYDAFTNTWGRAASMPTPRCYFLSTVLGNGIYVANEAYVSSTPLQTWDMYDTCSNIWIKNHDLQLPTDVHKLIPLHGMIYTIHELSPNVFYRGILGSTAGDEGKCLAGPDLALCCYSPTVLVGENLYMLDQSQGAKLMMWRREHDQWDMVGRLSPLLIKPPCQLAAYGRTILVVGRGLTAAAFDVDKAGRVIGTMVSSYSIPEVDPSISVLSCKTITL